ncbi:hypothetical protein ACFFQF_01305 [Haladaptatus pallidirubidus]|uniref:Uncharacterized protein n=1 Tax=Haladaptatus pallidirubidus TaxID=1008152 RepID=A0AAV3UBL3_9EURY|nr:hypothetical protein [Haladaptatus pallidirubidus]
MMWQDVVFLAGSVFSLLVLVPTLRDSMANIPLGTSLPSATIGVVYGTAFFSLGMSLSAVGSFLTGIMWSLIAALRSPHPFNTPDDETARSARYSGSQHAD